jgi:hypothetical protein
VSQDRLSVRWLNGPAGRQDRQSEGGGHISLAHGILGAGGANCVSVGDSASDVLVGLLADVAIVGCSPGPAKARKLVDIRTAIRAASPAMSPATMSPASIADFART